MWQGPGQDPGGGAPESGAPSSSSQELSDLKDQFEQQQVLIAQLKEMIRKSEQSNVTQEKVDEYMNTLSRRSAKAKKGKKDDDKSKKTVDIPASQKISLLRQQVEENKAKWAERGKSQKGIEEMVTQLKAQLDDSQSLISQTSFNNLSFVAHEKIDYNEHSSSQELYSVLLTKEKRISDLLAKVQKLETNVLDLQENLKEKDAVIDARTKAITLMTENLSKKGKNTLDALDDTKEQMRKMQENFVALEAEMKARQMKLLDDLKLKNYEIAELQELNSNLEKEKLEILQENLLLREKLENSGVPVSTDLDENIEINSLKEKIRELEELNSSLQKQESPQKSSGKKGKKRSPTKQVPISSETESKLEEFKSENERLLLVITEHENAIKELKEQINTLKSVSQEIGIENDEIAKLKKQLDDSNKNMIKVKAQHKSKVKELTKKIDAFKKVSDTNAEIVRLEAENCKLGQKIAELEEEKGSLQLKLVESDSPKGSETTEQVEKEFEEKIHDYVRELEEKDKIISMLEAANLQVSKEMTSIQLEEQMDSLENENKKLIAENDSNLREKEELLEKIDNLAKEKQEMSSKLDHYIQENIELVDKLEKLSAEKVSSAESIEIVEGLTQQEKLELEAYQKTVGIIPENLKTSEENLPQNVDLNESVNELTEETSELLQKIELFTVERREVMDKMELLKQENSDLNLKIKEIENNRDVLEETYEQLQTKFDTIEKENEELKEKLLTTESSESPEVDSLKKEVEDKAGENENLSTLVEDLQNKLEERDQQNVEFNNTLIDLKRTLTELESENNLLQERVNELEEYKTNLNLMIEKNQEELESVSNAEWETRRLLENKDNEIAKLIKERDNTQNVIEDLQKTLKEKDENFARISFELKEKYLALQKKLEENSGSLENIQRPLEMKVEELTAKNKEQLEKMKKIAANLKKKTQAYQELDDKYKEEHEKWESETREKDAKISSLLQQLQDLETEVARLKQELSEKSNQNVDLQNIVADLRVKLDKATEISLQQELLQTQSDFGASQQVNSNEEALKSKVQELEMIIETQESDLVKYRERVNKLEEEFRVVEEKSVKLEERANELNAQLQEKSAACEEISMTEDLLEKKLTALTAHDEEVAKKLSETLTENQELNQQIKKISEKNEKLKKKLLQTLEKVKESESNQGLIINLENQNEDLKKQVQNLENELKTLQNDYERVLEENKNFGKINGDWQMQFDEMTKVKNDLLIKLEKFEDQIKDLTEREIFANKELSETKTKFDCYQNEIQHSLDLKEEEIANLKKSLEEQGTKSSTTNSLSSFFDQPNIEQPQNTTALSSFFDKPQQESVYQQVESTIEKRLEEELNICRQQIDDYINQLAQHDVVSKRLQEVELEKNRLKEQIEDLQSTHYNSLKRLEDMEHERNNLESNMENSKTEIAQLRGQIEDHDNSSFFAQSLRQQQLEEMEFEKHRLEEELVNVKKDLQSSLDEIQELKLKVQELEVKKIAEGTVESVILEAESRITPQEAVQEAQQIPSFVWQDQSTNNDPFNFVNQEIPAEDVDKTIQEKPVGARQQENTQEELLNKIKTLEFMLFSVEKAKDDALLQCHELSNELTRLVFERENTNSHLESQILSENQIQTAPNELQKIEFEETKSPVECFSESTPIVEEVAHAKQAYLCFNPENQGVEAQVLQPAEIVTTPEVHRELQGLEFEDTRLPMTSSQDVIDAERCVAKDAYVCYEGTSRDTFGDNDDGWGLGPEEAKIEEEHVHRSLTEPVSSNEELKNKIRVLEIERENHLDEIKQLQIKSGKLIKKLKEMKMKNEKLSQASKKSDGDFFDLNDTIQEELKLQIQQIEKRLKEATDELEKEKKEKSSILKRIDVLTSANERMLEMKEKQDVELMGWQRSCKDLSAKLERFEWGDDGFGAQDEKVQQQQPITEKNDSELLKKIEELNDIIKDLTLDNEELQSLLEEQRSLRVAAEKSKSVEPIAENMKSEAEYLEVVKERNVLNDEKKKLQDEINILIKNNSELLNKFSLIETEKEELSSLILVKDQVIEELKTANHGNTEVIVKEKTTLFKELQEKNAQIDDLKESLEKQIVSLKNELETQITTAQNLLEENQSKDTEIRRLSEDLSSKNVEFGQTIEQLNREWQIQVDQRGSDIAESWKLHLESRESEFSQIETLLKKEINELEEKCNALVNENNELRKNVDTEIRNEVDRVSALQQQITDRQQIVNELTKQLQEKHVEIEKINLEFAGVKEELHDEREIVDEILKTLEKSSGENILREKNNLLNVLNRQINRICEKENEIVSLKQQIDNLHVDLSKSVVKSDELEVHLRHLNENHFALQSTIDEKNQTIDNLNQQLQQSQNLKVYENENVNNLQQNVNELTQINQQLHNQLQEYRNYQEVKEVEINHLKMLIEEKEREHSYAFENLTQESNASFSEQSREIESFKRRLLETENHYEELLGDRDSQIETLKIRLSESDRSREIEDLSLKLSEKVEECNNLQSRIIEQSVLIEEENKQLSELRAIIQEQVLKIEELKKELFDKSNDYDSLIAEMDISRNSDSNKEEAGAISKIEERPHQQPQPEEDLTEPVSRAELDLALYMLHQRDVRCEELTVELTQLLEERDTLQLRLSNAIREKEEFVRQSSSTGAIPKQTSSQDQIEILDESVAVKSPLESKLSQLKSVGYKRDKTIVDEQEFRRLQGLSILQQHKDVASKLPPEAAARLVDASYTLSRDVQSPSKVLLNWLWGRSTPKVNNI